MSHVQFPSGLERGAGKAVDLRHRDSTLPMPPAMAAIFARVHDAGGPGSFGAHRGWRDLYEQA